MAFHFRDNFPFVALPFSRFFPVPDPQLSVAPSVPFFARLQYIMPKKSLTVFAGALASARLGLITKAFIYYFIWRYGVKMSEAAEPKVRAYETFNDFFTRPLRVGARTLADATWTSPVDGAISQFGHIERDQIFQAKGHHYTTTALLGGDAALAAEFENGHFATLYLSPRDYHRIHMPCNGKLRRMIYVPGDLFSVNPTTARGVPGLFARNERVVCIFDTDHGPLAQVLVGATIVGSMETSWHGVVNPPRRKAVMEWVYGDFSDASTSRDIRLSQGAEMGRFLLGSTVVLLWPSIQGTKNMQFNPDWAPGKAIQLGEKMADLA